MFISFIRRKKGIIGFFKNETGISFFGKLLFEMDKQELDVFKRKYEKMSEIEIKDLADAGVQKLLMYEDLCTFENSILEILCKEKNSLLELLKEIKDNIIKIGSLEKNNLEEDEEDVEKEKDGRIFD